MYLTFHIVTQQRHPQELVCKLGKEASVSSRQALFSVSANHIESRLRIANQVTDSECQVKIRPVNQNEIDIALYYESVLINLKICTVVLQ